MNLFLKERSTHEIKTDLFVFHYITLSKNAKADEPITAIFYKRFPKALCMILQSGIASVR